MRLKISEIDFIANVWRTNRTKYVKTLHHFAEKYNTNILTIHNLVWF